ncbi:hypothetical protein [Actinophytocola sediminis]
MSEQPDEPVRQRKPLRRTSLTLLIGGIAALVVMVGTGLVFLAGGQDIGPGRPGVWPAGEQASVHKRPGPQEPGTTECEVLDADGEPQYRSLNWADSTRSSTEITIDCDQDAILLTGTASAVTSAVQSPLIMAPVAIIIVGILLFFPRFTLAWIRLSNPISWRFWTWVFRKRE